MKLTSRGPLAAGSTVVIPSRPEKTWTYAGQGVWITGQGQYTADRASTEWLVEQDAEVLTHPTKAQVDVVAEVLRREDWLDPRHAAAGVLRALIALEWREQQRQESQA